MVADMASFLGRDDEAARYIEHAKHIHSRFLEEFLAEGTGVFDSGTQAAQASALFSGLVPTTEREAAVQRMVDAVVNDHGWSYSSGYIWHEISITRADSDGATPILLITWSTSLTSQDGDT